MKDVTVGDADDRNIARQEWEEQSKYNQSAVVERYLGEYVWGNRVIARTNA